MLAALRILFVLGVRTVYLLGVDFMMSQDRSYHFDQGRSNSSIKSNRSTYEKLNLRFSELRTYFEQEDFYVFNCNPQSRLNAFDYVPFTVSIECALAEFDNVDIANERTEGLYDTKKEDKKSHQS
jgi:hypothetical protein